MKKINLLEILDTLPPSSLSYQEWLSVGMALKEEGYAAADWEAWSARDKARYHPGECTQKWESFVGSSSPVTAGTVLNLARSRYDRQSTTSDGQELGWDAVIGGRMCIVDKNWIEDAEVAEPENWEPERQLIAYLKALFEPSEIVGYVTRCYEKDGRLVPTKGSFDRTAGQLIEALSKCGGDVGAVLGDYNPEAGAWIRFNPLDGNGVKNENVTAFRYALVESDSLPIEKQYAVIKQLELPVAALTHSGGKSLHAIVRIDAADYAEYRRRVDFLYKICQKNGLEIDTQNRNPSRLSRMPGVIRKGKKQFLANTNIGKASFAEWEQWIEDLDDDLPELETASFDNLPELSPPLIEGVLRQGHKMLLAGPSKAGKSFALIQLCIAIAEGVRWLGLSCAQGRVLYVNLELDRASCLHRFRDVYEALGLPPDNLQLIDIWNLRGRSVPMDRLAPKLIRRAAKKGYLAIIIDPIYKVITGDENSADQMARFCNHFDKVCAELGCAVIYCHHHSKGAQGGKRSMDRASGSGVFARDPDALLDLIELPVSEALLKQQSDKLTAKICLKALASRHMDDELSGDDQLSGPAMLKALRRLLPDLAPTVEAEIDEAKKALAARTAWRVAGTLREFPAFPDLNLWFDYPIHKRDTDGVLADIDPDEELPMFMKAREARKRQADRQKNSKQERYQMAIEGFRFAHGGEYPTVHELYEELRQNAEAVGEDGPAKKTVQNSLRSVGYVVDKNTGRICPKSEET